jgi:hypothetical protein
MNDFELYYENGEKRIEFMTRSPWLKNKTTGQIVYSPEGYPIGDNARDPRWKGYPMSLHFNNGVMNALPLMTGPTEFYMSDGHYAMYVPKPTDYNPNVFTYARLLRERYEDYLKEVRRANIAAFKKTLKELETTKRSMDRELQKEYSKLKELEIRVGREKNATKRNARAVARGVEVAPVGESVKKSYDFKLAEVNNIEKNLSNVKTFIKQLKININSRM